jgi:hypothetical protein
MSCGYDAKHDVESAVPHLNDASKYLQVCNFYNFIQLLLNYIPNDFLQ